MKEILDKLAKIAGLCKISAHMSLPPVKEYKKPEPEEDGDEPEPAKLHYPRRKGDRPAPMPDLQGKVCVCGHAAVIQTMKTATIRIEI